MFADSLPDLRIVPLADLYPHEWYDHQRTPPLLVRVQKSGVFRNPVLVTPFQDDSGRFVVMDGANRTAVLHALGSAHALVQVLQPGDAGLRLRTWNHVLIGTSPARLLEAIIRVPHLVVTSSHAEHITLPVRGEIGVALLQTPDGEVYALSAPANDLAERIRVLNAVVNAYQHLVRMDRTAYTDVEQLLPVYPELTALVIFPKFNLSDLLSLTSAGALLPPGITRTTAAPRALHINFPLQVLLGPQTLVAKNQVLQTLLQARLRAGRVVYYRQPAFYFDE